MNELFELKKAYKRRRQEIVERLADFKRLRGYPDKRIFEELCFCLLTPQSKAQNCDKIISDLRREGFSGSWNRRRLKPFLKKARFYKKKAQYLILALKLFSQTGALRVKNKIDLDNSFEARQWLISNVKGLGYKEASHFLRNVGCGENLAILDIHILRQLKRLGIIDNIPKSISPRQYRDIEARLGEFSSKVGIPMAHLDLLFWSMGTGKIFK